MSKRRTRVSITNKPMNLLSEEKSFKDDGDYESGDDDDEEEHRKIKKKKKIIIFIFYII